MNEINRLLIQALALLEDVLTENQSEDDEAHHINLTWAAHEHIQRAWNLYAGHEEPHQLSDCTKNYVATMRAAAAIENASYVAPDLMSPFCRATNPEYRAEQEQKSKYARALLDAVPPAPTLDSDIDAFMNDRVTFVAGKIGSPPFTVGLRVGMPDHVNHIVVPGVQMEFKREVLDVIIHSNIRPLFLIRDGNPRGAEWFKRSFGDQ